MELQNKEFYWVRPKLLFQSQYDSIKFVAQYDATGWSYPIFLICGDDHIHPVDHFIIVSKVEHPDV